MRPIKILPLLLAVALGLNLPTIADAKPKGGQSHGKGKDKHKNSESDRHDSDREDGSGDSTEDDHADEPHGKNGEHKKPKKGACQLVGLIPLREFVDRNEFTCFKNGPAARANGFEESKVHTKRKKRRGLPHSHCNAVAVHSLGVYFKKNETVCLASREQAQELGFSHLPASPGATPTPVVTPVGTPAPTPTPTPTTGTAPSQTFDNFPLGANVIGNTSSGVCSAVLSGSALTIDCVTNVLSANSIQLDTAGGSETFCAGTGSSDGTVHHVCTLTSEQLTNLLAERIIVSIADGTPNSISGIVRDNG